MRGFLCIFVSFYEIMDKFKKLFIKILFKNLRKSSLIKCINLFELLL